MSVWGSGVFPLFTHSREIEMDREREREGKREREREGEREREREVWGSYINLCCGIDFQHI